MNNNEDDELFCENGPNLPAIAGFSEEHLTVNQRFIKRVIEQLRNPEVKFRSYAIEESWNGSVTEALNIEITDKLSIRVSVTTNK